MPKISRLLCLVVFTFFLSTCSHQGFFWATPSKNYERFLNERVEEGQKFNRARLLLRVRALLVEKDLIVAQELLTPGHALPWQEENVQVIAAIEINGRELFMGEDLKIFLNGEPASHIREISNRTEIENLYPFAYPFLRVFVVEFKRTDVQILEKNRLKVLSPVGAIELSLGAKSVSS